MNKHLKDDIAIAIICAVVLAFTAPNARAETPWVEVHVASKHSHDAWGTDNTPYNEVNTGLGIMFPLDEYTEVGFGGFINSYNKETLYTGFDIHTTSRAPVRYGVSMAVMTGYEDTPNPSRIMILPNLTIGNEYVRLKIGVLPGPVSLVTFTVGARF